MWKLVCFKERDWIVVVKLILQICTLDLTDVRFGMIFLTTYWKHTELPFDNIGDVHYSDVIMGAMASQITRLTIVYPTVYSGADQRKHQSSASLAFVRGIHRWPANSPHKWAVTRNMFPLDDVIMKRPQIISVNLSCSFHMSMLNDVSAVVYLSVF